MLDDMHPEMASEELTSSHQMIVDQDRTPSSICDSPEADVVEPESKDETAPPQKRKGGRKPVCRSFASNKQHTDVSRYMLPQKSANNEIDKLRLPSGSDEQNISNSSKPQSNRTRQVWQHCSRATGPPQMSVSCYVTRTHCWRGYC